VIESQDNRVTGLFRQSMSAPPERKLNSVEFQSIPIIDLAESNPVFQSCVRRYLEAGQANKGGRMNREDKMKAAWALLQEVELDKRSYTARGRQQVRETARISCSLPADVVRRLDKLGNARSHHVERAVKLYLSLTERFLSGTTLGDPQK
jgi:hypothetical protein